MASPTIERLDAMIPGLPIIRPHKLAFSLAAKALRERS